MKPDLSPPELERLALLVEEAGEVLQVIGKIIRHGYDHSHPKYGELTNKQNLAREIADFLVVIDLMLQEGDLTVAELREWKTFKLGKINKALRYNRV